MRGNGPGDGSPARARMWSGWRVSSVGFLAVAVLVAGVHYARVLRARPEPRQAIQQAVALSSSATSASVTFSTQVNGLTVLFGTVREQGSGSKMARLSMTSVDGAVRFRVSEIVTETSVYLSTPGLTRALGRKWLQVPMPRLTASPAMAQLYQTNVIPYVGAGLLATARTVRWSGTATINGAPTSSYVGVIDPSTARAKLDPRLRQLLAPELGATTGQISFTAWIDGAHNFRKIETSATVGGRLTVTTLIFSSGSAAVHIAVPVTSDVASLPAQGTTR
ncbi:MAG: hypothetical protein J2P28_03665 [Actinobacteria bacterium]|nr:hypothetical protein [Actinomycetota bacterium]MBO0834604.1 hypothetical protein [Actinomycetota bacterium]